MSQELTKVSNITMVNRTCRCCNMVFMARAADVKRGGGIYCSKACFYAGYVGHPRGHENTNDLTDKIEKLYLENPFVSLKHIANYTNLSIATVQRHKLKLAKRYQEEQRGVYARPSTGAQA